MTSGLLSFPICGEAEGTEKLSDLPKVTQLELGRAGIQTLAAWPSSPRTWPRLLPPPRGRAPVSRMSPALAGGFFTTSATWEAASSRRAVCSFLQEAATFFPPEIQGNDS